MLYVFQVDVDQIIDYFCVLQQGTIMLTHELNNYTMSEAIKYYPQLRAAFTVCKRSYSCFYQRNNIL